ncbi:MAG: hypothetical protein AAGE94_02245 [Acidobacteriota bacterium]
MSIDARSLTLVACVLTAALTAVVMPASAVELLSSPTMLAPFEAPQIRPSVAALADGGFVVVFEEGTIDAGIPVTPPAFFDGRDGDVEGIVGQRLDSTGRPTGPAFVVNTTAARSQVCPKVAADPSTGGFAVAWFGPDAAVDQTSFRALFLRRFDADGLATRAEILVSNRVHDACSLDLVVAEDGTVTLVARDVDGFATSLRAYRIDPDHGVVETDAIDASRLDIAGSTHLVPVPFDGGLVISGADEAILAVRLTADGRFVGTETPIGTGTSIDAVYRETPLPSPPIREIVVGSVERAVDGPTFGLRFIDPLMPAERPLLPLTRGEWSALATAGSDFLAVAGTEGSEPGDPIDPRPVGELTIRRVVETGPEVRLETGFETRVEAPIDLAINRDGVAVVVWERPGADNLRLRGNLGLAVVASMPQTVAKLGADERFEAGITWRDFEGDSGVGFARSLTDDTAAFWFFDPANIEVTVKVLDGLVLNGHFWVFQGSLSNVEYTLTVTDTTTGRVYSVTNPLGEFGSFGDTEALPGGD